LREIIYDANQSAITLRFLKPGVLQFLS
jgi:hypothetical protein